MNVNPRRIALFTVGTVAVACAALPAFAYVGPGAGLTLLGALWGLILAVVVSVGFVILWPFRRLLRKSKGIGASRDGRPAAGDLDAEHTMLANRSDDDDGERR
jgi:hypothetical protein